MLKQIIKIISASVNLVHSKAAMNHERFKQLNAVLLIERVFFSEVGCDRKLPDYEL